MDRRLLNRLKFHLARLLQEPRAEDWERIAQALDGLAGQAPDARTAAVSRLLASDEAALRAGVLPGDARRLLHELEEATRRAETPNAAPPTVEQRVAAALRGRAMVVIGGDPRPEHRQRLEGVFGASQVLWPVTREGAPDVSALEPLVSRPDVIVVVLLIRWIRHALNDVAALCERHDKALARATAGYNPAQIAAAIHEQCGKRLGL